MYEDFFHLYTLTIHNCFEPQVFSTKNEVLDGYFSRMMLKTSVSYFNLSEVRIALL